MSDDIINKALGITGAATSILAYVFYNAYKSKTRTATEIKGLRVWHADDQLYNHISSKEDSFLAYAAVDGNVEPLGRSTSSRHGQEKGVMLKSELVEHKTKKINGFWTDEKKQLRASFQHVPFALVKSDDDSKHKIEVLDANIASHIQDELDITHDVFTPHTRGSLFQAGLDRLVGDVTKGIQETEKMLLTGTSLLGVGRVVLEQGEIKLSAPEESNHPFILTKMHMNELVRHYQSSSKTFKILAITFGVVGCALLIGLFWRNLKIKLLERRARQEFEEIRRVVRERPRVNNNGDNPEDRPDSEVCVVCLANDRQVITLNCGHISMCADCAEALPLPKLCPVCRAPIERFMPVYYA